MRSSIFGLVVRFECGGERMSIVENRIFKKSISAHTFFFLDLNFFFKRVRPMPIEQIVTKLCEGLFVVIRVGRTL